MAPDEMGQLETPQPSSAYSVGKKGWIRCHCGRRFKHIFSLSCHQINECGYGYQCLDCAYTTDRLHNWLEHRKRGCGRPWLGTDAGAV